MTDKNILHAGIDFSQKKADFCLLHPDGRVLDMHHSFGNSKPGFQKAKQYLLEALKEHDFTGLHIGAEATSYYWMPFFMQLADDPELGEYDLQLYLQNPKQVHWFKKSFAEDDKTDAKDPYYIAERIRVRRQKFAWQPQKDWLALRFLTRLRFHLTQALTREKNFYSAHLFIKCSAYGYTKPFADIFGATSGQILQDQPALAELADLPTDQLADRLKQLSNSRLPNPHKNAQKLIRVAQESFPVDEQLTGALQIVLDQTLEHVRFLERQIECLDALIRKEVYANHPEVLFLVTIRGIALPTAAGIASEIGDLERFFLGQKWDKRKKRYRPKNLRDVEDAVAKFTGLWWPRSDSGDFEAEERHLSKKGNRYLRYYLYQAANKLRLFVPEYQAFYTRKFHEVSKHQHKRALTLTARKSLGLFVGLLHRQEPYRSQEV